MIVTAIDMPLTDTEREMAEDYVAGHFRDVIAKYPEDDNAIDGFQALTAEYDAWFFKDQLTEDRAREIASDVHPHRDMILRYLMVLGHDIEEQS